VAAPHVVPPAIGVGEISGFVHRYRSPNARLMLFWDKVPAMQAQEKLKKLLDQLNTVIVGKPAQVRDCVACLLAGGHLLIVAPARGEPIARTGVVDAASFGVHASHARRPSHAFITRRGATEPAIRLL
jgi:hypothetical protein